MAGISDEQVEAACAIYAKETGYYVEFHRGLRSASSDKMRKAMRAALEAALLPRPVEAGVPQLGAGSEHDLHNVLKSVLFHFGTEGAAKVTKDALAARPEPKWLSIETAPKDQVIRYRRVVDGKTMFEGVALWRKVHFPALQNGSVVEPPFDAEGWMHPERNKRVPEPTHWMPTPTSPATGDER